MRIEAVSQVVFQLPITPAELASLRGWAWLSITYFFTMIEGNLLIKQEVSQVTARHAHFPGRTLPQHVAGGCFLPPLIAADRASGL